MRNIYIFISYGHDKYAERTQRLYDLLGEGRDDFVIWWDKKLQASDDWIVEIESRLNELIDKKSDSCFIYVVTPYSSNTDRDNFCIKEIAKAIGGHVRIIPVKMVEAPMPLLLGNIQWMDFTDIDINEDNQELMRRIEYLRSIIQDGKTMPQDGKQEVLQSRLEPCTFTLDLEKHLSNFGERQWLLQRVNDWIEQDNGHLLLLLGGPGTGKTAFSIWMSYSQLAHHVAAWHLCQYNDMRTCSLRNTVKSLAYYLANRIPDYYSMLDVASVDRILNETELDAGTLFKELILEKLQKIDYHEGRLVILIDALDEASHDNRNELAEVLSQYVSQLPSWLKFIITSRNDVSVTTYLEDYSTVINLDDETVAKKSSEDVGSYVESQLGDVLGRDSSIAGMVTSESGNNFLYAHLLCNSIKENPGYDVSNLPRGINNYYSDHMRRYFTNRRFEFATHAQPLLNLILSAYEPLQMEDIYKRLHETCDWCRRRSVLNDLVHCFGPLLKESSGCLVPFHKSLSDWFLDEKKNQVYKVYREDGLEEMASWGLEVVNDELADESEVMTSHFYKYLPKYLIEAKDQGQFLALYTNQGFWERRHRVLGVNQTLILMMDELALCGEKLRQRLFGDKCFFSVLNLFNIDLFNTGRYKNLHQLGYSIQMTSGMDDDQRLFAVRFYYISELYAEVIDHIDIFEEPYKDPVVEAMLMNELGQTYRKYGMLERSAHYYERSLSGAIEHGGTEDEIIYTMLNLSRIRTLQCREAEARDLMREAVLRYDKGLWRNSMQGADFEFSSQQLERAVRFVALETECYAMQPDLDVCRESLAWADGVYAVPLKRDRYYANHLLSKLYYQVRTGCLEGFLDTVEECRNAISGKYDNIRLACILSMYYIRTGQDEQALQLASEQLEGLSAPPLHAIQRTELSAIRDFVSKGSPASVGQELTPWYHRIRDILDGIVDKRH